MRIYSRPRVHDDVYLCSVRAAAKQEETTLYVFIN